MNNKWVITKANGEEVYFDQQKFLRSMHDAGASKKLALEIMDEILEHIQPKASTQSIYRKAFRILKKHSRSSAAKYNLKRAIMTLGPSGYPFEQLMGAILKRKGYDVSVGVNLKGFCVQHEVDVVAEGKHELILMECKFHNQAGHKNDVKIPLYVHARFMDLQKSFETQNLYRGLEIQYWVASNTRFTADAIKYAECNKMRLLAWDYPTHASLRDLIQQTQLHPISCLTSISQKVKKELFDRSLISCKEIIDQPSSLEGLGLSYVKQKQILNEIEGLFL